MSIIRTILAVVIGLFVGSVLNMGLITISGSIIPPPAGVDMTTAEGLSAGMSQLQPQHFLFPFLAHALGTLAGAFIAAKVAVQHKLPAAMAVGVCFFAGGIMATQMIPAPGWFIAVDLILAYFPCAWLGHKLAAAGR